MSAPQIDLTSIQSTDDLKKQALLVRAVADKKMDDYMKTAPEYVKRVQDFGVPKEAIFGVGGTTITLVALFILISYGAQILAAFITVLQPLWYTYRALETDTQDDDTILLTYWMVHGVLYLAENSILIPIVHFLPGPYFLAKIALLFWMLNFQGSTVVYKRFLQPYFRENESKVKDAVGGAQRGALAIAGFGGSNTQELPAKPVQAQPVSEKDI